MRWQDMGRSFDDDDHHHDDDYDSDSDSDSDFTDNALCVLCVCTS